MNTTTPMKCIFKKDNGGSCGAFAMTGSKYCFFHNPQIPPEEKSKVRRRGGMAKINLLECFESLPETIQNPSDIAGILNSTMIGLMTGKISPKVANSIGFLSNQLIKVLQKDPKTDERKGKSFTQYLYEGKSSENPGFSEEEDPFAPPE